MAKQNFQQPLLQSSESQHNPSEIILLYWFAQETFLIITVENIVLLTSTCGHLWGGWTEFLNEQYLFENNFLSQCKTFDKFNAPL